MQVDHVEIEAKRLGLGGAREQPVAGHGECESGGIPSAFCDPVKMKSTSQRSISTGMPASDDTASTMVTTSSSCRKRARSSATGAARRSKSRSGPWSRHRSLGRRASSPASQVQAPSARHVQADGLLAAALHDVRHSFAEYAGDDAQYAVDARRRECRLPSSRWQDPVASITGRVSRTLPQSRAASAPRARAPGCRGVRSSVAAWPASLPDRSRPGPG